MLVSVVLVSFKKGCVVQVYRLHGVSKAPWVPLAPLSQAVGILITGLVKTYSRPTRKGVVNKAVRRIGNEEQHHAHHFKSRHNLNCVYLCVGKKSRNTVANGPSRPNVQFPARMA